MAQPEKQTKVSSFLTSILPEVKTEVAINQANLMQAGAIIFIVATLIFLSWFTFKKIFK